MVKIYEICGQFFMTPELCVQSAQITYSKVPLVASIKPNDFMTQVIVQLEDGRELACLEIKTQFLRSKPEHL